MKHLSVITRKHCLMNGLDDIDFLLTNKDKIEAWEKASK